MLHTTRILYGELSATLAEIETQIKHIKNDIKQQYPEEMQEKINVWYWMRTPDGKYVLEEMLAAKSRVLLAMAELKAAELNTKVKR